MTTYVLVNNNQVLNGPRNWNYRSFESTLEEDLGITIKLPMKKEDTSVFVVDEVTKIYPSELLYPEYNSKIEYLHGPFWTFSEDKAIGTFEIKPNEILGVKNVLKAQAASVRWQKEIAGIKALVQGIEVTLDTSREGRNIFVQKLLLMSGDETVKWKFPEGWLVISREELSQLVTSGVSHIQRQFDWEASKLQEIDACQTLEELDRIEI